MAKLKQKEVILSVTIFVIIAYVICFAAFALIPEQAASLSRNLFHGLATEIVTLTISSFIIGLISWLIISIIGTALFVWIYNKFSR